jgi:Rod binding domain-containing protein
LSADATALSSLGAGLPPIDQAALPADVRKGTKAQKETYQAALGFERMLVGELTKSMLSTAQPDSSSDSSSSSGSSSSSDSTSSDATTTLYQQMLPDKLADAVTAAGGIGLADQLYRSLKGPAK